MTTRSEKLDRLAIESPCEASWDGMEGDDRRRHCRQCDREVHDLGRLTPREIALLIEASRGYLCGRITRDADGRLVTAAPDLPALPPPCHLGTRRAGPVAAAVVGGLLGLGAAAPGSSPAPAATAQASMSPESPRPAASAARVHPERTAAGAGLAGRIADEDGAALPGVQVVARNAFDGREHRATTGADGRFAFDGLAAGSYEIRGELDGYAVAPQTDVLVHPGERREVGLAARVQAHEAYALGGAIAVLQQPLHRVFAESELVVAATAGASTVNESARDYGEVTTEFIVDSTFKGRVPDRSFRARHAGPAAEEAARFAPGTRVLAFLKLRSEDDGPPVYESADYSFGLRALSAPELAAYGERLTALARLERHGAPRPADLVEWMVATVENPLTRGEEVHELRWAQNELAGLAKKRGTSLEEAAQDLRAVADRFADGGGAFRGEIAPALLAAYLTDGQRERLSAVFRSTPRMAEADFTLFAIVRPWAGDAALTWLAKKLAAEPEIGGVDRYGMESLASEIGDDELQRLVTAAEEEIQKYKATLSGQPEDEAARLVEQKAQKVDRELRHRFVAALGARPDP